MRKIIIGLICLLHIGYSSAYAGETTPILASPHPKQVADFERPLMLAAARNSGTASPLVVLRISDPWRLVMGSDSPHFALYDDGTVIYQEEGEYRTARLSPTESQQFLDELQLDALAPYYGGFNAFEPSGRYVTEQPIQDVLIYAGPKPIFISVYGSLKNPRTRTAIPAPIIAAYDRLSQFSHPGNQAWLPDFVEMMIWPYEYAPDTSLNWPTKWPDLKDPATVARGEDGFSLYIPSAKFAELQAFLNKRTERGAIKINRKKWAASLRFPFPKEELWMSQNLEAK